MDWKRKEQAVLEGFVAVYVVLRFCLKVLRFARLCVSFLFSMHLIGKSLCLSFSLCSSIFPQSFEIVQVLFCLLCFLSHTFLHVISPLSLFFSPIFAHCAVTLRATSTLAVLLRPSISSRGCNSARSNPTFCILFFCFFVFVGGFICCVFRCCMCSPLT